MPYGPDRDQADQRGVKMSCQKKEMYVAKYVTGQCDLIDNEKNENMVIYLREKTGFEDWLNYE